MVWFLAEYKLHVKLLILQIIILQHKTASMVYINLVLSVQSNWGGGGGGGPYN